MKQRDNRDKRYNFVNKDTTGNTLKNIDLRLGSEIQDLLNNPEKYQLDRLEAELIKSMFRTDKIWENNQLNILSYMFNTVKGNEEEPELEDFFELGIKLWKDSTGHRDLFIIFGTPLGTFFITADGNTLEELLDNFILRESLLRKV